MNEQDAISLRHYLEDKLKVYINHHAEVHKLIDKALGEDKQTMNQRLEGMNEFRAQLNGQAATFVTKDEVRPLQQFVDRFIGIVIGVTVLNTLITYLIVKVLTK